MEKENINKTINKSVESTLNNEYIIKTIWVEGQIIPLKIKKDIPSNIKNKFNHLIDTNAICFIGNEEVFNDWVDEYKFDKNWNFETAFTGAKNRKIFLLYFIRHENYNYFAEINLTFNIDITEDINEIFFVNYTN
jgi:hypothetical protein